MIIFDLLLRRGRRGIIILNPNHLVLVTVTFFGHLLLHVLHLVSLDFFLLSFSDIKDLKVVLGLIFHLN